LAGARGGTERLGHPEELPIGEALERLADVREGLAVANRQVVVRQPLVPPPRAAIDGHDHAVDRLGDLQLEPPLAAAARLVRAAQILAHPPLPPRPHPPPLELPPP